jgi:hypothetical protein
VFFCDGFGISKSWDKRIVEIIQEDKKCFIDYDIIVPPQDKGEHAWQQCLEPGEIIPWFEREGTILGDNFIWGG